MIFHQEQLLWWGRCTESCQLFLVGKRAYHNVRECLSFEFALTAA